METFVGLDLDTPTETLMMKKDIFLQSTIYIPEDPTSPQREQHVPDELGDYSSTSSPSMYVVPDADADDERHSEYSSEAEALMTPIVPEPAPVLPEVPEEPENLPEAPQEPMVRVKLEEEVHATSGRPMRKAKANKRYNEEDSEDELWTPSATKSRPTKKARTTSPRAQKTKRNIFVPKKKVKMEEVDDECSDEEDGEDVENIDKLFGLKEGKVQQTIGKVFTEEVLLWDKDQFKAYKKKHFPALLEELLPEPCNTTHKKFLTKTLRDRIMKIGRRKVRARVYAKKARVQKHGRMQFLVEENEQLKKQIRELKMALAEEKNKNN
eukprot:m.92989 g.92989  ORF g.92989 m.92989 type:complete len:324 (+) comp13374_c0_seq1:194-1165(+)